MSSGNSGSIQSSSGGDEEYDSRSESISTFLNSSGNLGQYMLNPQPPTSSHHQNHPSSLFDPLPNYLEAFSQSAPNPNANSLLNSDMVWSIGLRSEPNCTDIGGMIGSLSSSIQPISGAQGHVRSPYPSSSSMPLPLLPENGVRSSPTSDQTKVVRNSKKRSRASRRAPTTVLTTDTSNFRAMVQEFTGIPAPPFSASPFSRSRFDLFSTPSTMRSTHLEPSPSYLLRPLTQKVSPSFVSSSSFSASTMIDAITAATSNSTSANNYQLPSDLGLSKQPQNPVLTFQSHLQSPPFLPPPKYPLANVGALGAKSQDPSMILSNNSQRKVGLYEEFGMSHANVNTDLIGSERLLLRSSNNPSSWRDTDGDQGHLKSFNGRVSSCKMNYSTSSSDFHADKGSENVSSRGEGMVDSWICSSD